MGHCLGLSKRAEETVRQRDNLQSGGERELILFAGPGRQVSHGATTEDHRAIFEPPQSENQRKDRNPDGTRGQVGIQGSLNPSAAPQQGHE